jgi:hypothetical protein
MSRKISITIVAALSLFFSVPGTFSAVGWRTVKFPIVEVGFKQWWWFVFDAEQWLFFSKNNSFLPSLKLKLPALMATQAN